MALIRALRIAASFPPGIDPVKFNNAPPSWSDHGDHLMHRLAVAVPAELEKMRFAIVDRAGGVGDHIECGQSRAERLALLIDIVGERHVERQAIARDDEVHAGHAGLLGQQNVDALVVSIPLQRHTPRGDPIHNACPVRPSAEAF